MEPEAGVRRTARYWGPALITVGIIAAVLVSWVLQGTLMYWGIAISAALALVGVVVVGADRLNRS